MPFVRLIKHEVIPDCGSFEVRDGMDVGILAAFIVLGTFEAILAFKA
jgi:hypothetical protein